MAEFSNRHLIPTYRGKVFDAAKLNVEPDDLNNAVDLITPSATATAGQVLTVGSDGKPAFTDLPDVTAGDIASGATPAGKVLGTDGSGGAEWIDPPSSGSVTVEQVDSESATSGQVIIADGSGGASWGNPPAPAAPYVVLDLHDYNFTGIDTPEAVIEDSGVAYARVAAAITAANTAGKPLVLRQPTIDNVLFFSKIEYIPVTFLEQVYGGAYHILMPNNQGTGNGYFIDVQSTSISVTYIF